MQYGKLRLPYGPYAFTEDVYMSNGNSTQWIRGEYQYKLEGGMVTYLRRSEGKKSGEQEEMLSDQQSPMLRISGE